MAALTWREVSAPSFGSANDMLRTAAVANDRALTGLQETLKGLETKQKDTTNASLLARASQIQDPAKLREALTSGSLFQGVNMEQVDPRVLDNVNSRVGQLLNQAATQQGIDTNQYKLDRTKGQDAIEDAARAELAANLGLTGSLAKMSTADQQGIAKTQSGLVSDRLSQQGARLLNEARAFDNSQAPIEAQLRQEGARLNNEARRFNNNTAKRDDEANQAALGEVAGLLQRNATTDDLRRDFEETPFATPQARTLAHRQLEQATGERLYAPITADVPAGTSKGGAPTGSGGAGQATNYIAQAALQDLGRRTSQNNAVGITADIEKNLADTSTAPEVAKRIAGNIPEGDQGAINDLITAAQAKYPELSAADIGSALERSTSGNWLGTTDIGDVGVDRQRFDAMLQSVRTGKAEYNSDENRTLRTLGSKISKADENLTNAKAELVKQQVRAQSQTGIDTSRAEAKVARMEQALKDAIERSQDPQYQPKYVVPPTPTERRRGERGRANNSRLDRNRAN